MDPDSERVSDFALKLTTHYADEGKLIEAGWLALKALVIPDDASEQQVTEMRMAFFSGALHLFSSICTILRAKDEEPTAQDMARMSMVRRELDTFLVAFKAKHRMD